MKCISSILLICAIFFSKLGYGNGLDSLMLADALQSNMVIQQNKPFKVWGQAKAGEKVQVSADWAASPVEVVADQAGHFLAIVMVPEAKAGDFSSRTLTISAGDERMVLSNLLIGDVWICSGQSNMQFAVKEMVGAEQVLASADQPGIRLLNVHLNFSDQPIQTFKGEWRECSPESVSEFSAVGYSFGKKLNEELNIPIGLIFTGIGASAVQAYIPKEDLANDSLLNTTYLEPYLNDPKSKERIDGGFSFEKVVRPYLLYNAIIHPLVNISLRGFIWYQGEANHRERESYIRATQTMIKSWRRNFAQGQLPFYYVQIAPFNHGQEDPTLTFDAYFREAQEKVSSLNNTYMMSSMDVGEEGDIHPKNKRPVGERLAAVALNREYNRLDVAYRGPRMDEVIFKKGKALVYFEAGTIGGGLRTNDGEAPKFFYVAGKDRVFHPAEASIKGDHILVESKTVKDIYALRYAFSNYPVTNLENKEGFPAHPFRTDDWEE
jgi:sialate O-acetylesterase